DLLPPHRPHADLRSHAISRSSVFDWATNYLQNRADEQARCLRARADGHRMLGLSAMTWRVGVDVGGTFTDLVAVNDRDGTIGLEKGPPTPADQSIGVATGLDALFARHGIGPAAVTYLGHGTTVCINAVLEKKGARTGLVTTLGMRDLLELRRQIRDDL